MPQSSKQPGTNTQAARMTETCCKCGATRKGGRFPWCNGLGALEEKRDAHREREEEEEEDVPKLRVHIRLGCENCRTASYAVQGEKCCICGVVRQNEGPDEFEMCNGLGATEEDADKHRADEPGELTMHTRIGCEECKALTTWD